MSDFQGTADIYLENDVLTATPQRLRLMLIQAALRFTQQTIEHFQAERSSEGLQTLVRAQTIVSELQTSVRADQSELATQVSAIYTILYCELVQAQFDSSVERLAAVARALEEERETWQLYCEQSTSEETIDRVDLQPPQLLPSQPVYDLHEGHQSFHAPNLELGMTLDEGLSIEA